MFYMRISSHTLEIKHPMNKPSPGDTANLKARHPQRTRGHERVAQLLRAGAEVFAEKGFDAATMTEIASRAEASIGSLYQFFPNKDVLADKLHDANLNAIGNLLDELGKNAEGKTPSLVADTILAQLSDFLLSHPEFATLSERRNSNPEQKIYVRDVMRGKISQLLQIASPPLLAEQADTCAVIILHLMKALVAIHQEAGLKNPEAAVSLLRNMLKQSL